MRNFILMLVAAAGLCQLSAAFAGNAGITTDKQGNVYVVDSGNGSIHKYAPDGSLVCDVVNPTLYTPLAYLHAVAVDKRDGAVYFASLVLAESGTEGRLFKATLSGNRYSIRPFCPAVKSRVGGLAVDKDGNVYVAAVDTKKILKLDSTGNELASFGENVGIPMGVAVDANNTVYFTSLSNAPDTGLWKAILSGSSYRVDPFKNTGMNCPYSIAVDDNGSLYVVDAYDHAVRKFNSDGKEQFLAAGPDDPDINQPVAVAVNGSKLYFTTNHQVFRTEANRSPLFVSSETLCNIAVDKDRNSKSGQKGIYFVGGKSLFSYDQETQAFKSQITYLTAVSFSGVAVNAKDGCLWFNTDKDTMSAYPPEFNARFERTWQNGNETPKFLTFDGNGTYFIATRKSNNSWYVVKSGDVWELVLESVIKDLQGDVRGLAVDKDRSAYVSLWSEKGSGVYKATRNSLGLYSETREFKKGKDPRGIAVDLNKRGVYVIDGKTVCKYDESGELMSHLASGVDEARDIAIDGGGQVYVLCSRDGGQSTVWKLPASPDVFVK